MRALIFGPLAFFAVLLAGFACRLAFTEEELENERRWREFRRRAHGSPD